MSPPGNPLETPNVALDLALTAPLRRGLRSLLKLRFVVRANVPRASHLIERLLRHPFRSRFAARDGVMFD